MEATLFQRIQSGLLEKRHNLAEWFKATPAPKKRTQLGPSDETDLQAHLMVLDQSLEKATDQTLGLCEVCHDYVNERLLEMNYTTCICLDHFSEQERRQLEEELEFLQVVQRALLPQQAPEIPGLEVAAFSRPAQIVSGDYFDFFQFRDGAHGLAIADAMGHGVSASLIMNSLQTALRTLVPDNESPAEVLQRVNRLFLHNINVTTFVTAVLCHYDPATRVLTYSNAGHNPPLLSRYRESEVAWLKPTGAAIGLVENYKTGSERLVLSGGDVLTFYTDGVSEATNPQREPFGSEGLAASILRNRNLPAQELLRALGQELEMFANGTPLEDDITLVILKVLG